MSTNRRRAINPDLRAVSFAFAGQIVPQLLGILDFQVLLPREGLEVMGQLVLERAGQFLFEHFRRDIAERPDERAVVDDDVAPEDAAAEIFAENIQIVVDGVRAQHGKRAEADATDGDTVSLTNGGKPLVGFTVNVTSSLGTVNKASAVTNAQGQADFVLTNAMSGTSAIVASAQVILPVIRVFQSEAAPEGNQPIGGPGQSIYDPSFQAAATWISPSGLEEVDEPRTAWLLFLPALEH